MKVINVVSMVVAALSPMAQACYEVGGKLVMVGQPTKLCVVFNGKSRISFDVVADKMTALQFGGSFLSQEVDITANDMMDNRGKPDKWSFFQVTAGTDPAASKAASGTSARSPIKVYKRPYYIMPVEESRNFEPEYFPLNFPIYTAIVSVNLGVVTGITWDDGCFFCITTRCKDTTLKVERLGNTTVDAVATQKNPGRVYPDLKIMNSADAALDAGSTYWRSTVGSNCFQTSTQCRKDQQESLDAYNKAVADWTAAGSVPANKPKDIEFWPCDLSIYVTFTGTDESGRYLKSAGLRFSRFRSYSIGSLYKSAAAIVTNYLVNADLA